MTIKMERWSESYRVENVDVGDLVSVYQTSTGDGSLTFTWNDLGDRVVIVSVGDKYSTVTKVEDGTFSDLVLSEDDAVCEIEIAGQLTTWPKAAVLPRDVGLEVLLGASNFDSMVREYVWRSQ